MQVNIKPSAASDLCALGKHNLEKQKLRLAQKIPKQNILLATVTPLTHSKD